MAAVLVLALFLSQSATQPCHCVRAELPCTGYWEASAVFVGKVDAVTRTPAARTVTFSVLERFKGEPSSTIDLTTGAVDPKCSIPFRTGREYLVYAYKAADGRLTTTMCSRTRDVEDAASDLAYARAVKDGSAPAGRVTGRVLLERRDLSGKTVGLPQPVADIAVRAVKDGVTETAASNYAGDFELANRGPGRYAIAADIPERYYAEKPAAAVELRDARSCAEIAVPLHDNGRIEGRVLDAAGRPVAGLTIDLAAARGMQRKGTVADRSGRYEFARLPPGRYLVGINTGPQRSGAAALVRLFHPGVERLTSATRVVLGSGQRLALPDFKVPSHVTFVTIAGVVLDPDGRPAAGARVFVKGAGEDGYILSEPSVTDVTGRFAIAAPAGAEYRVFAERPRDVISQERVDSSDPVLVAAADGFKPLRLTLHRRY